MRQRSVCTKGYTGGRNISGRNGCSRALARRDTYEPVEWVEGELEGIERVTT